MPGINSHPHRWSRGLEKSFDILARLYDRAQMMVIREPHTRRGEVIGDPRQLLPEPGPSCAIKPWRSRQGAVALAVYRVAGLGIDEHRAAHSLQQPKMCLQGRYLFTG